MSDFVTTNLRLPKEQHRELKLKAITEGESLAELIRRAIDEYLGYKKNKRGKKRSDMSDIKQDPFFKIIGLVKEGPIDASVNHDHYIYGLPKK